MENIIVSRLILGIVCAVNLLAGYVAMRGVVTRAINRKKWILVFVIEIVAITAYIVYDNMVSPCCKDEVPAAVLGYAFVYLMAFLGWVLYCDNTKLQRGKIYTMKRIGTMAVGNQEFIIGEIGEKKIRVLLDNTLSQAKAAPFYEVQFDFVKDHNIIVILVEH